MKTQIVWIMLAFTSDALASLDARTMDFFRNQKSVLQEYEYGGFCNDQEKLSNFETCLQNAYLPVKGKCYSYIDFFFDALRCIETSCEVSCVDNAPIFDDFLDFLVSDYYEPGYGVDCTSVFEEKTWNFDSCLFMDNKDICRFGNATSFATCFDPFEDLYELLLPSASSKIKVHNFDELIASRQEQRDLQEDSYEYEYDICITVETALQEFTTCTEDSCNIKCENKTAVLEKKLTDIAYIFHCEFIFTCPTNSPTQNPVPFEYEYESATIPPTGDNQVTLPPRFTPPAPDPTDDVESTDLGRILIPFFVAIMLCALLGCFVQKSRADIEEQDDVTPLSV